MKKSFAVIAGLVISSVVSAAHAFSPTLIKKDFKCSDQNDYSAFILETSGVTLSYSLKAFCSVAGGDGGLVIVNDR